MARPVDPNAQYHMSVHKNGTYVYASTQVGTLNKTTGRKVFRRKHWGTLDENLRFEPNKEFILLTPEERKRFVFPQDWDLSALKSISGTQKGPKSYDQKQDRLYGDIWLLEQIAEKTGLRQDLNTVFDGNKELVNRVLTLAIFPYITNQSYNRLERWQRIAKAPYDKPLTPCEVTRTLQAISTMHRNELFSYRAKRLDKSELCAFDSTTRGAHGRSLSAVKWGKSKDRPDLPQTSEVVVYSLTNHMPIYYRTLPGNMPDSRSFRLVVKELDNNGFPKVTLVTDRGYECVENLENMIRRKQKMITAISTSRALVSKRLRDFGLFSIHPDCMHLDPETSLYVTQFEESYSIQSENEKNPIKADNFRIHLYLNPEARARCYMEQEIRIEHERAALLEVVKNTEQVSEETLGKDFKYFRDFQVKDGHLTGYELDIKKVNKERLGYGFFSLGTLGLKANAHEALEMYSWRDEQEKYFSQMKSHFGFNLQSVWTEESKTGREFVLFVGLIMASYLRHIWKSTSLQKHFDSSLSVLDEMRSIRLIQEPDHIDTMTPFVGAQLEICEAFGFEVPKKCKPGYKSQRVKSKKS